MASRESFITHERLIEIYHSGRATWPQKLEYWKRRYRIFKYRTFVAPFHNVRVPPWLNWQRWPLPLLLTALAGGTSLFLCFIDWLVEYYSYPYPYTFPWGLFWFLWASFWLLYWLIYLIAFPDPVPTPEPSYPQRPDGIYGNGGYAYLHEISQPRFEIAPSNASQLRRGVFLQQFIHTWGPGAGQIGPRLSYYGNAHGVTIAPTRSHKGTAAIIPTLLTMDSKNIAVLDMKGENYFVTHPVREKMGHTCHVINPWNLWGQEIGYERPLTVKFNPLASLSAKNVSFVGKIEGLAASLIEMHDGGNAKFFTGRARQLVAVVMAYVAATPSEIAAGHNNLVRVMQILNWPFEELSDFMRAISRSSKIPYVRDNAASFSSPKPSEAKSIQDVVQTCLQQLNFLNDPSVRDFMSARASEKFDFSILRKPNNTVYIIFPVEKLNAYRNLLRLMVQSMFDALWKHKKTGEADVLMILDEQYQLGNMEILRQAPGVLAGYGVQMWSIFQNIGQLKESFGSDWTGVLDNAGFVQVFTPGPETAAHFSRQFGKTTVISETYNEGWSSNNGSSASQSYSQGRSSHPAAVDAFSPQMLQGMPDNEGLVILRGLSYPLRTTRKPYMVDDFFRNTNYLPNPTHTPSRERALRDGRNYHANRIDHARQYRPLYDFLACRSCGAQNRVSLDKKAQGLLPNCGQCGKPLDVHMRCPNCQTVNRASGAALREGKTPNCGRCKSPLYGVAWH